MMLGLFVFSSYLIPFPLFISLPDLDMSAGLFIIRNMRICWTFTLALGKFMALASFHTHRHLLIDLSPVWRLVDIDDLWGLLNV
jgi:hypothetical protein